MFVKKIKISNFKSIYDTQEFDFTELSGLIKLSGPIGVGKTTLGEALLYGLYGTVKGQNNTTLASWNTKGETTVELDVLSRNKEIHIIRNLTAPLEVTIDGKLLAASNKRNAQEILEEEYYDIPRLVVEKMCIISFNQFKSLASMTPADTKIFLDEVFGFNTFTEYNNYIVEEKKDNINEQYRLQALYDDVCANIEYVKKQKDIKQQELLNQIDIDFVNSEISRLNQEMQDITDLMNIKKNEKEDNEKIYKEQINEYDNKIKEQELKINEYKVLGKQEKDWINTFKQGICPTCGHKIDDHDIQAHKDKMNSYVDLINECKSNIESIKADKDIVSGTIQSIEDVFITYRESKKQEYSILRDKLNEYNSSVITYEASLNTLNANYDQMIIDYTNKMNEAEKNLNNILIEIGQWNEMNELFSKTFRYNLLNQLIPQINKSIQIFINKFELNYTIKFDQEFKSHIFADNVVNEISYSSLSTGQKKTLDIAIILGILQNIISSVDFNILFCDELFSNMDINSRNTMLQVLEESNLHNRTIFVINHSEMPDDAFAHKIRVEIHNKNIKDKKDNEYPVHTSKYEKIF